MQLLLLAVGVCYAVWGQVADTVVNFVIIALVVAQEVLTELRAKRAVAALQQSAPPKATVWRAAARTSCGDGGGRRRRHSRCAAATFVAADAVLLEARSLQVNEAALTSEPAPVAGRHAAGHHARKRHAWPTPARP